MPAFPTIFLIDDDEMARELIGNLLCRAIPHARVLQIERAEVALASYQEHRPDLIITDMRLLGMSGAEFVATIRKTDQTTPIFVISGAPDAAPIPGCNEIFLKTDFRRFVARAQELMQSAPDRSPDAP